MKRIDIDIQRNNQSFPFWMPWGMWGTIWRYLLFLSILFVMLLLMKWLISLSTPRFNLPSQDAVDEWSYEPEEYLDYLPDQQLRDDLIGDGNPWGEINIPNPNDALPSPDLNELGNPTSENTYDYIVDPDDPYSRIVESKLNIIFGGDENDDEVFNRFAHRFKQLYPDDREYFINYYNRLTRMMQIVVPPSMRKNIYENLNNQIPDIDFKVFYEEVFDLCAATTDKYNDPAFQKDIYSWQFEPIQAFDAWNITKGNSDIIVAVVDSYIDVTHPELSNRVVKPYNVATQNGNVLPPHGMYSINRPEDGPIYHGTHVAALAVGGLDNEIGSAGIAPNCKLMPVALGRQITSMKLIEGVLYAINQGADVINVSIASYFPEGVDQYPLSDQIEYIRNENRGAEDVWDYVFKLAEERNVMIVWAAGNCNVLSGLDETKRNSSTLRVSCVDNNLQKSDFSNYGDYQNLGFNYSDITAPGNELYSAIPGGAYGMVGGTSMAAPLVSGAVALMKSVNPSLTNKEIIEILRRTGKPLDPSSHIGPLIQIRDALIAAGGTYASYDEITDDPSRIVGLWETTERRPVVDPDTNVPTGAMTHIFLKFDSPRGGTVIFREDTGHEYTAPFSARIDNSQIRIDMNGRATSTTTESYFVPMHLVGERADNGLLAVRHVDGSDRFLLRRINSLPNN